MLQQRRSVVLQSEVATIGKNNTHKKNYKLRSNHIEIIQIVCERSNYLSVQLTNQPSLRLSVCLWVGCRFQRWYLATIATSTSIHSNRLQWHNKNHSLTWAPWQLTWNFGGFEMRSVGEYYENKNKNTSKMMALMLVSNVFFFQMKINCEVGLVIVRNVKCAQVYHTKVYHIEEACDTKSWWKILITIHGCSRLLRSLMDIYHDHYHSRLLKKSLATCWIKPIRYGQ